MLGAGSGAPGVPARPTAFLVCSGLGHVARGFETFTRECHEALRDRPEVRSVLVKGRGRWRGDDRTAWTVRRDRVPARALGALLRRDAYAAEQAVFAAGLIPQLVAGRADVVLFSDWRVGRALARWRRRAGGRFRLVFSNGGGLPPPYPADLDHVHHVAPVTHEAALAAGEPEARHTLLPYGLRVGDRVPPVSDSERRDLRTRLGLPQDARIVLSVAALNVWHKRLDYVVDEVAALPAPRPHLVLLGQAEEETPAVLARARERLGPDGFTARTEAPDRVSAYYLAADAFVLASLYEPLGRVLLEALAHGLEPIAQDSPTARFVVGDHGRLVDLRVPGALTAALAAPPADAGPAARERRHRHVRERFGWDVLAPAYAAMLVRAAATAEWNRSSV